MGSGEYCACQCPVANALASLRREYIRLIRCWTRAFWRSTQKIKVNPPGESSPAVNYLETNPRFVAVLPCEVDTIKLRKSLQYVEKMSTEFFILGCSILSAAF